MRSSLRHSGVRGRANIFGFALGPRPIMSTPARGVDVQAKKRLYSLSLLIRPHAGRFLIFDPPSAPPHISACTALAARGSSSTCRQFQSRHLYAVLAPHCARYAFPSRAPSPPRSVGRHATRSRPCLIFVTTFSTTRRGGGCKSHTSCSMVYV